MTRRTRRLSVALALLLCASLGIGLAWLPRPRSASAITRKNAALVQHGMTRAEVEELLGGPARDETTGPVEPDVDKGEIVFELAPGVWSRFGVSWIDTRPRLVWRSDDAMLAVYLDSQGRIAN